VPSNPGKPSPAPDIEALKKRHRELENLRIAAQTNLKTATDQLEQLKKESLEQYGTDDLKQLEAKLEDMKQDNERKRVDYARHLAEIENSLSRVEQDRPDHPEN
jgi:uncharacterized protein YaaN involved in tellurite resistance